MKETIARTAMTACAALMVTIAPSCTTFQHTPPITTFVITNEIINTKKADDPYPFVGALHFGDTLIGSGVLIHESYVLTAAHVAAAEFMQPTKFELHDGTWAKVESILLHPVYEVLGVYVNDIALIRLSTPIRHIQPIALKEHTDLVLKNDPLFTCGYSNGIKSHSTEGVFVYLGRLLQNPRNIIWIPMTNSKSVWFGDSGGMVASVPWNATELKLIGIIGYLDRRQNKIIENGAASIDHYRDWIRNTMTEHIQAISNNN